MAKSKNETEPRTETESTAISQQAGAATGAATEALSRATNGNGARPDKVSRARGVRVSLFRNRTNDGQREFMKVSIQKVYKEGAEFKTTSSLGRDDIPTARYLLEEAWKFILESEASRGWEE